MQAEAVNYHAVVTLHANCVGCQECGPADNVIEGKKCKNKYVPAANGTHTKSVKCLQADAELCAQAQVVELTAAEHRADVAG